MPGRTSFGPSRVGTALVCQLSIVFLLAASTPVFALATCTWTGLGGDGKWTTAANWAYQISPVPGDYLVFPGGTPGNVNDFPAFTSFSGIFLNCMYCGTGGNSITLGADGIRNNRKPCGYIPQFVTLDIALGEDSTLEYHNGPLAFSGVISGAHNLTVSGSLNCGAIVFLGANTYSGITLVNGELEIQNDLALGASDGTPATGTTVTNGTLALLDRLSIGNEALTLNENSTLRSSYESSWAGPITLNAMSTIAVTEKLTLSGLITGTGGITKTGSGLLRLTGTINPGAVPGGAGDITVNGALALDAAVFVVDLDSVTSFDRIVINNGTVDLGGSTLTVNDNFGSAIGDRFNIVVNHGGTGAVVGTFKGLPEGALFSSGVSVLRISYVGGTGNDVTLTRVAAVTPDPAAVVPMLDGRGMLIFGLMIAGAGVLLLIRGR